MPLRRSAATKVMVFQCPCGTRPISLSPRGQRPLSRTILVLAAVSSTKTRWAGSNMPCSRIQRWRARATSARSCSAARRLFFESDIVTLEEAPHRAAAARNLVPVHRQNRLVQGQVWPSRNQTQQKICMLLQRRDASAPRLSRTAARLPKALDPDNRRAGTDNKLLGRRAPRRPAFNFRNHSRPHVFRIGLRHRPASQNRINADRLSHPSPPENLLDSIGTEHALASQDVSELEDVVRLFRGEFLEDLSLPRCPEFQAWRIAWIDEVNLFKARLLQTLIDRLRGDASRALPYAHALHALHPQDRTIAAAKQVLAERAREQAIKASTLERPEERHAAPSVNPPAAEPKPDRSLPIDIRFCTANDGARIAYSVMGEGPPIVKTATWMSHLQFDSESPIWRHWIEGLAAQN